MESIGRAHRLLARYAPEFCVGVLAGSDVQERIRRVVHAAEGNRPTRSCPLHPVLVLWLVLCLPLQRALSISNVFVLILSAWRSRLRGLPLRPVSDGALAHARVRLGVAPVRALFEDLAAEVEPATSFHGRRVWAMDGVHLTAPDTPANEACFGRPGSSRGRSAFPQIHLVTLASTRTHEVRAATWRPVPASERAAALDLISSLGAKDLLLLDRGFYALWLLDALAARGIDFLVRVPADVCPTAARRRGKGDYDVVLHGRNVPRALRAAGAPAALDLRVRLLQYTLDGKETIRLATTMTDPRVRPDELVRLYHERWEAEIAYDELKTHLATVGHGTLHTVFRGRSPAMVEQELWATLALYNLIRRLIGRASDLHGIDARRISFTDALLVIRDALPTVDRSDPGRLVSLYVRLVTDLGECVMPRWRRPRRIARVVKVKMSNYALKRPADRCVRVDFLAGLTFLESAA